MASAAIGDSNSLLNCSGNNFFYRLQKLMNAEVAVTLKRILMLNHWDSALVFQTFNQNSITDIESFMRHVFNDKMLKTNETLADYLGRFEKCPEKFVLSSGQIVTMQLIADTCRKIKITDVAPVNLKIYNSYHAVWERSSEDQHEQFKKSKKENIEWLFRCTHAWMTKKDAFKQIRYNDLNFRIVKDSYERKPDGRVTCIVECPMNHCSARFTVYFKAYQLTNVNKPLWEAARFRAHILSRHSGNG